MSAAVTRARPTPEPADVLAASLAALAESAVLYLPLNLALSDTADVFAGPAASYPLFVATFTVAVAAATAFSRSRNLAVVAPAVAVAFGVLQAGPWGSGDPAGVVLAVIAGLLIALRVVALALRDWRDPILGSFGVGTVAMLVEVLAADGLRGEWAGLLSIAVPQFFLASLASRAASIWTAAEPAARATVERRRWGRQVLVGISALAAFMAAAIALGARGGLLERTGDALTGVVRIVASGFAFLLSQLARPIFWLVDQMGIDPESAREFLDRLRGAAARRVPDRASEPDAFYRALGFLLLVVVAFLLARLIRRQRARLARRAGLSPERGGATASPMAAAAPVPRRRRSRPRRGELPADTVRRWYAEILLLLQRRGLAKPPTDTPAEFLPLVARAFPDCAGSFSALTRAYEDIRYGNVTADRTSLRRLAPDRDLIVRVILRQGPAGQD